jgi:hypothetical protein
VIALSTLLDPIKYLVQLHPAPCVIATSTLFDHIKNVGAVAAKHTI